MALSSEQIHAAADELDAQGVRPTLAAVRKRLGSGSFTTISEGMSTWRTARIGEPARAEPIPEVVAERFEAMARDVWAAAVAQAEARLAAERETLAVERAELLSVRDDALATADALTVEFDEHKVRAIAEAEQLREAMLAAEKRTDAELARADESRNAAEKARVELAELAGRLTAVLQERDRLAADLAAAQKQIGRLTPKGA